MKSEIIECYNRGCGCPIRWDFAFNKIYIIDQHHIFDDHCNECGEIAKLIYFDFIDRIINEDTKK